MPDIEEEKDDVIIVEEEKDEKVQSGELDSSKEEEKVVQKTKPVRKRGNDANQKINQLWLARKEAEEEASKQASIAAAEKNRSAQYEQITASALEESLASKRELLKEKLIRANENADAKAIGEIQAELSKVEAQSAQIDRYKIENKVQPQQQNQQQHQPRQQQIQEMPVSPEDIYERMSPSGQKWLDENNDWYAEDSENYDQDKASDVKYFAQTLEKQLIREGRAAEIGTKGYFNKINGYIEQNWSDPVQKEEAEDEPRPAPQKKNYAAPVGNRGAGEKTVGARKEYKISQAEKELALSLDTKDPKTGKPMSDVDKIKRFVGLRDNTPSSGPISIKTLNKGV